MTPTKIMTNADTHSRLFRKNTATRSRSVGVGTRADRGITLSSSDMVKKVSASNTCPDLTWADTDGFSKSCSGEQTTYRPALGKRPRANRGWITWTLYSATWLQPCYLTHAGTAPLANASP